MNTPHDSSLGREVAYPAGYDPALLFPIPRAGGRAALGLDGGGALPFIGHDRWHAYELGWLDARGKPQVATATVHVPATSPSLVESKSLKLYLNSLNAHRFADAEAARACIAADLSACAGAPVAVALGLPPLAAGVDPVGSLDDIEAGFEACAAPDPAQLRADASAIVDEYLHSALLKSNCPVTGQPDWASVHLRYRGPRIDRAGLLRYLVGFREHAEFHEQCVERVFLDVLHRCAPHALSVEARYTRRGGLDINPWRATPGTAAPMPLRDERQ
ncbi:NADPH-dependent 7-cyano-7-deazaguanine reductase QueF [Pseudoxanthomonas broegbernensis]|uniref:NADPH-dependent 7-cyano-7-deazaguanine reductase n=1 Tax=Pseudoxanthomonas broegbernensis TaxID=83619 RepID=A0A7V8GN80_9GAMM|nr:NADPH-dependent 7-cyano-7-deazaguanine reductase QueF [Pseudoxanthomonas broegbernensis]KAF1686936.1 NADPH-dependent 7-cyano-7-deazaguanine reductase QueF [Pseudoxanthomonas broegbernensis]MBB6065465.1 7-cyano-7-deazaguanine reductase [Pseudoxanthomonas broegbernensis]